MRQRVLGVTNYQTKHNKTFPDNVFNYVSLVFSGCHANSTSFLSNTSAAG